MGHNEFYGAMGVASSQNTGGSRVIIKLALWLKEYRTYQLLRNTLAKISKTFSTDKETQAGTLMEKMVQKKHIGYGSDVYEKGLTQFEGNLNDILHMITDANVPVIVGTITSNLKDQRPFVSDSFSHYPPAENIFSDAKQALSQE